MDLAWLRRWVPWIAGGTGALLVFALAGSEHPESDEPIEKGEFMPPPDPLIIADRQDPEISALLREFDDELASRGIRDTSAAELMQLPKAPGRPIAVPPRDYWPRIFYTLEQIWAPVRQQYGAPIRIRAYRPPAYNTAVGGVPYVPGKSGSRHMYFEALDLATIDRSPQARRKLAQIVGRIFNARADEIRMGFGAYGHPAPRHVHVDAGWRKRTWRDARKFLRGS